MQQKEAIRIQQEQIAQETIQKQQNDLAANKAKQGEQLEKNQSLQSAFNADRKMLQSRIDELEKKLSEKLKQGQKLEHQINIMGQQDNSLKNEINFWNGKVSTLKRDLDFQ